MATEYPDGDFPIHPECWGAWAEADMGGWKIRGQSYMTDKKKMPAGPYPMKLAHVDLRAAPKPLAHVAARPDSHINQYYQKKMQKPGAKMRDNEFWLVVNFRVPGSPGLNLVLYFFADNPKLVIRGDSKESTTPAASAHSPPPAPSTEAKSGPKKTGSSSGSGDDGDGLVPRELEQALAEREADEEEDDGEDVFQDARDTPAPAAAASQPASDMLISKIGTPTPVSQTSGAPQYDAAFYHLMDQFLNGTDKYRDERFKFIPRVIKGGWIVRKGVGEKPAVFGKRVTQNYFRDPVRNYIEVDVDLSGSKVAGGIFSIVKGYAKSLIMDMSYVIEGQAVNELPERILSGVRIMHCDTSKLQPWPPV